MSDDQCEGNSDNLSIKFKSFKKRPLRHRHDSEESDESENEMFVTKLGETKEIQKLRKRPNGVSVLGLDTGLKVTLQDELINKDSLKIKSGGMLNMKALKTGKIKPVDDAYDTGIGTQFSAETNKRDEDDEMMKYIDEQLAKRKGDNESNQDGVNSNKYLSPEEAALQALPDHLRLSSANKSEEMLSNQMLSGIPEVDLGIEAKIKNIEATEDAKIRLLWEKRNKQEGPSQFVPANMAVNFVQHNRFNIDCDAPKKKKYKFNEKEENPKSSSENPNFNNKQNKKDKGERATDDYHYEKFKKQFRRF